MATAKKPQPWKYESRLTAQRKARERLQQIATPARQKLAFGDVLGARAALAQAAPNAAGTQKSQNILSNIGKVVKARLDQVVQTSENAQVVKKVGDFAAEALPFDRTEVARAYLRENLLRFENDPEDIARMSPEEVREKVAKVRGRSTGLKKFGEDLNTLVSGEAMMDRAGINTEWMDKLRTKGPLGKVASAVVDTATAPGTILTAGVAGLGAVGVRGSAAAASPLLKTVGQAAAKRFVQETAAGAAGIVAGEVVATETAKHTDNPWIVGGAALASGVLAGSAAYNPKATARTTKKLGRATANELKEGAAQAKREGVRGMLANEVGQSRDIRPGEKLLHGTQRTFDNQKAVVEGAQGGGGYITHPLEGSDDLTAAGRNADVYNGSAINGENAHGAQTRIETVKQTTKALTWNAPADEKEIAAIRNVLPEANRAVFDDVLKTVAEDGRPVYGHTLRYATEMAYADEAHALYTRSRTPFQTMPDVEIPGFPDIKTPQQLLARKVDTVFKQAGFGASTINFTDYAETVIRDVNDLESYAAYGARKAKALEDAEATFAELAAKQAAAGGRKIADPLPPGVKTPQDLADLRMKVTEMAVKGQEGRFWYERSGKAILNMFNGDTDKAEKFAQLIAIYSPKKPIDPNFNDAMRVWGQWQAGDPITVGSMQQWKTATEVLNGKPWTGRKTNSFYRNMMGYIDPVRAKDEGLVTVDRHIATAFGHKTTTDGSVAISDPQYELVQREVQAIAADLGWTPEQTQAAIWVTEKAMKDKTTTAVSKFDFADSLDRKFAQVSWESMPGKTSGVLPELHNAPFEVQLEYHHDISKALLDDQGRDIIDTMYGIASPGDIDSPGVYYGPGGLELNPGSQNRVGAPTALQSSTVSRLVPAGGTGPYRKGTKKLKGVTHYDSKGKPYQTGPVFEWDKNTSKFKTKTASVTITENINRVDESTRLRISAAAATRGMLLNQEAVPWTRPFAAKNAKAADSVAVDIGRTLTREEAGNLSLAIGLEGGAGIIASPDGVWIRNFSGLDNESFQNLVIAKASEVLDAEGEIKVGRFTGDGEYVSNALESAPGKVVDGNWKENPNGEGYRSWIDAAGASDVHEQIAAILRPRIRAIQEDYARRLAGSVTGDATAGRPGLSDAAGNVSASVAAQLATTAGGAAYGYSTGDDQGDRWKRALAFSVAGAIGSKALTAGASRLSASSPPVAPGPRPATASSPLANLSDDMIERRAVLPGGRERIVPKQGTSGAERAIAAKQEALHKPGAIVTHLPPVLRNGVALLNPSSNMDQTALVAWRARQGVKAQLNSEFQRVLTPLKKAVTDAWASGGATYKGPKGDHSASIVGTLKDIADRPELYDITPELRTALDDLGVAMWDEVSGRVRLEYGVDVQPYSAAGKADFVYLPTLARADSIDDKFEAATAGMGTSRRAKRRAYQTAADRMKADKEFVPETDLDSLVSTLAEAMASNAGNATFKHGAGGRRLVDVIDELHPTVRKQKDQARAGLAALKKRILDTTANKQELMRSITLDERDLARIEKRLAPISKRVDALEEGDEFGAELSYLSGQQRELELMRAKIMKAATTKEGRMAFADVKLDAMSDGVNQAQKRVFEMVKAYETSGTGKYVQDPHTFRWYTAEQAKTINDLMKVPTGFGKQMLEIADEIRAFHLAGDFSPMSIQGQLGVLADPITAMKSIRAIGRDPRGAMAKIFAEEADDVSAYTFATGRQFGEQVAELGTRAAVGEGRRGLGRVPAIAKLEDDVFAGLQVMMFKQWQKDRTGLLKMNPGMSPELAASEAASALSKMVPGLNPAERGVSGLRAGVERLALTSTSFAAGPAMAAADAGTGYLKLARAAMQKLAANGSGNPASAWQTLSGREQLAIQRTLTASATVTGIAALSAMASAESRGLDPVEAVRETFDPNSRYFMALQLGDGRSIPLGGPFRSAIKAVLPDRNGIPFGNMPGYLGSKLNSPVSTPLSVIANRDFYDDKIYEGNVMRPENLLRVLWYGAEGVVPVTVGEASEAVRKGGQSLGETTQGVIGQFAGTNYTQVSPTEKLNQLARTQYDKSQFYDLLPSQQDAIKKANPELWGQAVKKGSDARQQAEAVKAQTKKDQEADDQLLLAGKLNTADYEKGRQSRQDQLVGAERAIYSDSDFKGKKGNPVLEGYYAAIDDATTNGRVDWDQVSAYRASLSPADDKLISDNSGLNKTPLVALRSKLQSEYYELPRYRGYDADQALEIDNVWQLIRNNARSAEDADMLRAMRTIDLAGIDPLILKGVKRRIMGVLRDLPDRNSWKKAHPESALILRQGTLTQQDIAAIKAALG